MNFHFIRWWHQHYICLKLSKQFVCELRGQLSYGSLLPTWVSSRMVFSCWLGLSHDKPKDRRVFIFDSLDKFASSQSLCKNSSTSTLGSSNSVYLGTQDQLSTSVKSLKKTPRFYPWVLNICFLSSSAPLKTSSLFLSIWWVTYKHSPGSTVKLLVLWVTGHRWVARMFSNWRLQDPSSDALCYRGLLWLKRQRMHVIKYDATTKTTEVETDYEEKLLSL